ncbi:hypothetical protein ACA910_014368 [Epithemia clementina (nom. ined.)]
MTTTTTQFNAEYRAALALNNMATTLLEKKCFDAALCTFGDSLLMMQRAFVPPEQIQKQRENRKRRARRSSSSSSSSSTQGAGTLDPKSSSSSSSSSSSFSYEQVVQAASRRYAQALKQQDQVRSSSIYKNTYLVVESSEIDKAQQPKVCEVTSIEDDDIPSLRAAMRYGPSSTLAFPIRIMTSSSSSCDNAEDEMVELTKQFGILLYNHGLASFLVSTAQQPRHLKRSQSSLQAAETTFLSALHMANQGGEQDTTLTRLLMALSLTVLSVVFQDQGKPVKVREAQQAVSSLCSTVDEHEPESSWVFGCVNGAGGGSNPSLCTAARAA